MDYKRYNVKLVLILSTVVELLVPSGPTYGQTPVSENNSSRYSEGSVSSRHGQDFNKLRIQYFYTDQKVDLSKVSNLEALLQSQIQYLQSSAKMSKKYNLIDDFGANQDKADKSGEKAKSYDGAESLAPFYFALDHIGLLKKNIGSMSPQQIHETIETILLFYSSANTIHPEGIVKNTIDRLTNIARNFLTYEINDKDKVQASNLLDPKTSRFLDSSQISQLQEKGEDLSKLNPPSSAFWTNNEVEKYDPKNEIYFGQKLFPDQSLEIPEFFYEKMGNGNIKIKTHFYDTTDLNKKGEPSKKDVTIRLGHEVFSTPASGHFARVLGYYANPNTFRKKIKLNLDSVPYDQFIKEWLNAHGLEQGSPLTHIERIPGEPNAVYIKNANLEAYPDSDLYRKMGPFRMGDNGYNNRREYRAMLMYLSLISMSDQFEYQSRVDAFRNSKNDTWKPLFFISDTGQSLGMPTFGNPGDANEFYWKFTYKNDSKVYFYWLSIFNSHTWEKTTYSDLKWMARRIGRIQPNQIEQIFKLSGFPEPVAFLYSERMKSRINQMIKDFNLSSDGYKEFPVKNLSEIHSQYPNYIDDKGYLKDDIQQIENNTAPLLGKKYSPWQAIKKALYSIILNTTAKVLSTELLDSKLQSGLVHIDIDKNTLDSGSLYKTQRDISVNSEVGPKQHRYQVADTVEYGLPIGIVTAKVETPFALYKVYNFKYIYSVDSLEQALSHRFFKRFNPFALEDIKEHLSEGEQLVVSESFGASIGRVKISALDQLKIDASLLGISTQSQKMIYFSKLNNLLEVFVQNNSQNTISSGFDIEAQLRLAFQFVGQHQELNQKYYKIETYDLDIEKAGQLNQAFDQVLFENDFSLLDKLVVPAKVVQQNDLKNFKLALLAWGKNISTQVSDLQLDDKQFIAAQRSTQFDRSFDRLWSDQSKIQNPTLLNAALKLANKESTIDVLLESKVNSTSRTLESMELNVSISKSKLITKKEDLKDEFLEYFNIRYNQKDFIKYQNPDGIDQYLNLYGQMRWQLNQKAVLQVLEAMTKKENLDHLIRTQGTSLKQPENDSRNYIAWSASKLKSKFNNFKDQKEMKKWAKEFVEIFNLFIGQEATYVGQIRKYVQDNDLWVVTTIEDLLADSHPTFRLRNHFWADEIGQFQGQSELSVIRRTKLMSPIIMK